MSADGVFDTITLALRRVRSRPRFYMHGFGRDDARPMQRGFDPQRPSGGAVVLPLSCGPRLTIARTHA